MIVGLTGGIGSGKSTVSRFFMELGIPVYNSDQEAKLLMIESEKVRNGVLQLFGQEAYTGKKLNKTYISEIVFSNKEKLRLLNQIVHPAVRNHFLEWASQQNAPYVIQETALIFENHAQTNYDVIILVTSPEHTRIQRVMDRDGVSQSDVTERIENQLPDKDKKELADYVIENIELEQTKKAVKKIHKKLLTKA